MEIHSFETTCCTFACDAFVWKRVCVCVNSSIPKKKHNSHVTILSLAELVQWTVNRKRLAWFVFVLFILDEFYFFLPATSHTSQVHPLNFLCPNFSASHGKCWLVFYFLSPSSGHLVRRVVWRAGGWVLGGGSQVPHTLLKTYECIITLTKTICSTTLSEDSSWCASEPLGLGSSVLSVRYQLGTRSCPYHSTAITPFTR